MTDKTSFKARLLVAVAALASCFASIAVAGDSRDICDAAAASKFDSTRPANIPGVENDEIDVEMALVACRDSVNGSVPDANNARYFFQLGRALAKKGMKAEAIAQYEKAANAGHLVASVNLATEIEDRDPVRSFTLTKKAADGGNVLGYYNLGVAYQNGVGTTVDGKSALEAYTKALELGDDVAAYNAAVLHDEGKLVPVDKKEAIRLYTIAADRNNVDAMLNLAITYENGDGVTADKAKALGFFKKAAALGDAEAARRAKKLEAE